jgi:hypothetical protein
MLEQKLAYERLRLRDSRRTEAGHSPYTLGLVPPKGGGSRWKGRRTTRAIIARCNRIRQDFIGYFDYVGSGGQFDILCKKKGENFK